MESPEEQDKTVCELAGDGAVTRSDVNLLIRRIMAYHYRPMSRRVDAMEKHLDETERTLREHLQQCALNQARIIGGIRVLTLLISSGFVVALLAWLVRFSGVKLLIGG